MTAFFILLIGLLTTVLAEDKLTAVVLVGPYKTGSSWVQRLLFEDFKEALEKENYHSVFSKRTKSKKHLTVAKCYFNDPGVTNCPSTIKFFISDIKDHYEEKHNIIIASEGFSKLLPNRTEEFFKVLENFDVKFVITHRDYLNVLISTHNQMTKSSENTRPIRDFLREAYKIDIILYQLLSVDKIIPKFIHHVPKENFFIIDFNGVTAAGIDIVEVILMRCFPGLSADFRGSIRNRIKESKVGLVLNNQVQKDNAREDLRAYDLYKFVARAVHEKYRNSTVFEKCSRAKFAQKSVIKKIPLICADEKSLNHVKELSLTSDREIRKLYAPHIIMSNATATEVLISQTKPTFEYSLCSVDGKAARSNAALMSTVRNYLLKCMQESGIKV